MTVSNVINAHPHVKAETRNRVLRAMDELGYRVNIAARNLRAGRTGTIGLAVPEIDRPYFGQLAARLIALGAANGFRVAIEQTGASRESELAAISDSRLRLYDGVILSAVSIGSEDELVAHASHPVVLLGEQELQGSIDHVAMANEPGARIATEHLIDRGCHRIAILTGELSQGASIATTRHRGYVKALESRGVEHDDSLTAEIPLTMQSAYDEVTRMLNAGSEIDGMFCVTDTVAFGAMRAVVDQGLTVPGDIKVVGFDNVDEARFSIPRLTSIDPDHNAMAEKAMALLMARINDPDADPPPTIVTSTTELVVRESTGAPSHPGCLS